MDNDWVELENRCGYPEDSCIIWRPPEWMLHYAPSEQRIYVDSTDYHAKPLRLSAEDLRWLLAVMEGWNEELKTRILAGLENNDPDYITQIEIMMARAGTRKGFKVKVSVRDR